MSDPSFNSILTTHFLTPIPNVKQTLLSSLKYKHPNAQHVAVSGDADGTPFPLSAFLSSVQVDAEVLNDIEAGTQKIFEWDANKKELYANVVAGTFKFTYLQTQFCVYKVTWSMRYSSYYFYDIVFDSSDDGDAAGQKLAAAVYAYANSLNEEIWVFQNGNWKKSHSLYSAIETASWDDLVLDDAFKEGLRRDTDTFFASRELYESLGIPWKRGILLLGPPGNGKTESIKALLKQTGHPVLYVKTIATPYGPEYGVRSVFEHARKNAPCILVLEDLDSMIGTKIKSFFLNEMDGLARNNGILTLASTNHPEDIDDAIINRPSRFDIKYTFALPTVELRRRFAVRWLGKIGALRLGKGDETGVVFEGTEEVIAGRVAEKTEGWSFAFLKELFVSFLLCIAYDKSRNTAATASSSTSSKDGPTKSDDGGDNRGHLANAGSPDTILFKQLDLLSSQIIKLSEEQERARKDKKQADGEEKWCPPGESESSFLHGGENF